MIKYSTSKILKANKKELLFDIIIDYSKYKYFLPWCIDSYNLKSNNCNTEIISKLAKKNCLKTTNARNDSSKKLYSILLKNEDKINKNSITPGIKELDFKEENIEEGVLVVGLGVMNFSYSSIVIHDRPNFVYSTVDEGSSIFSKLESIWKIKDIKDSHSKSSENIEVNYEISFEFKSVIYKNLTEVVLNNMGKLLMESFLKRLDSEYESYYLNKTNHEDFGIDPQIVMFLQSCNQKGLVSNNELFKLKKNLRSEYFKEYYSKLIDNMIKNSLLENKYYLNFVESELKRLI